MSLWRWVFGKRWTLEELPVIILGVPFALFYFAVMGVNQLAARLVNALKPCRFNGRHDRAWYWDLEGEHHYCRTCQKSLP